MWDILIVAVFEFIYMFLRTVNIESIVKSKATEAAAITAVTTFLWVVSLGIGMKSIMEGDFLVIASYILAAASGAYFGVVYNGRREEEQ